MPREFSTVVEKNREIRLRDGTPTYADIYRPAEGGKAPVIVVRTPYNKEGGTGGSLSVLMPYQKFAERGYVVVVQDTRGRFESAGEFSPYLTETNDGYDTVAWAAKQPWSNGATALMGASYYGATTLLGARSNPPGLRAVFAHITTDEYYETWSYHGGAFQLGFLGTWGAGLAAAQLIRPDSQISQEKRQRLAQAIANAKETLSHRPLTTLPGISEPGVAPWWKDWTGHTENDAYWRQIRVADSHSTMRVAGLHSGGWFDIFLAGTLRNFVGMTKAGLAPQKMVIGPWAHGSAERHLGAMDFGATGPAGFSPLPMDAQLWFDRHLMGKQEVNTGAPVRYFLLGANAWQESTGWPIPGAATQRWFFQSRGSANSLRGDGVLTRETPSPEQSDDVFLYNPDRPVPTQGGNTLMMAVHLPGPHDQRDLEERDDVLVYTSPVLQQDLKVVGPVTVHLWATTDGRDTDWTAKLLDVQPDGKAVGLCDGIIRARYRQGTDKQVLLTPGQPYEYTVDLVATANLFKAGHRVRVEVSSSNFPRFDRNSNTGGKIQEEATGRTAVQRVHHTASRPSFIELPVLA